MVRVLLFLLPLIAAAQSTTWNTVQSLSAGTQIEVRTGSSKSKGTVVSIAPETLVLRDKSGEHSVMRSDVREVKIRSTSRRIRRGIIGTAIGVGAGLAAAFLICHSCINESSDRTFVAQGAGFGALLGAGLSFPFPAYQTVYKTPKR